MLPEEYGGKAGPMSEINRKSDDGIVVVLQQTTNSYNSMCRSVVRKDGHLQGLVQGPGKDQS